MTQTDRKEMEIEIEGMKIVDVRQIPRNNSN